MAKNNYITFLPLGLLGFIARVVAQLPYNPTRIISAHNGSVAYVLRPQQSSSQFSLSLLDTSSTVDDTTSKNILFQELPFLSSTESRSFTPMVDEGGLDVLAGDCQTSAKGLELWRFTPDKDQKNGTWSSLQIVVDDASLSANFLAAGASFSPSTSLEDSSVYVFGGMCPNDGEITAANWVSDATYSNTMLTLSPEGSNGTPYELSVTGARAPPIAEAGLTMTPLTPSFTNSTSESVSQQQNFVLLGGHTQSAFINMSQVAIFSLPQESWTFVGVDQPQSNGNSELLARDVASVEPRSGHTAVLSEDGSKIIVFGGWVGDISTPALPQLAILNIGEGYGGNGSWAWTIPTQTASPYGSDYGVYGHGAAMLPGNVMIVTGGSMISSHGSKFKRGSGGEFLFLNTTSMQWVDSYINPSSPSSPAYKPGAPPSSSGLSKTDKTGLGTGLGLGIAAVTAVVVIWLLYSRRLRQRRSIREKELRELALGAERYVSPTPDGELQQKYPERRSASWHNLQERSIESSGSNQWPLPPDQNEQPLRIDQQDNGLRDAARTGILMDVPSPTRGLRRSLHSRGPIGMFQSVHGGAPGSVFRIDEEEENSQGGSFKRAKTPKTGDRTSVQSDPFKDPPGTAGSTQDAAQQRQKEVQGWVEDWQSAAESMTLSRNPSQATHGRTYSNLSQAYANSQSSSDPSGRGSPDKSDRTGSNLSEKSVYSQISLQRSTGDTVSRTLSQRSASAGYALFSGAATAMGRLAGSRGEQSDYGTTSTITRFPSNRSVSLNAGTSPGRAPQGRERAETFSSARTSFGPVQQGEDQALLSRKGKNAADDYWTPPQSPVKERQKYARTGSLTRTGVKAMGLLGSMKRVFSGTGGVSVQDRVANFENRSESSSPTKSQPEMTERSFSNGEAFWRGKRGARDWEHEDEDEGESSAAPQKSLTVRRKPLPGQVVKDDTDDDDWDVETAVQQRVVQVMFTVPKEKLRVVNADALSLLSSNRSDVDHEEERDREREVKRMSSVREGDEDVRDDHEDKGKESAVRD
jgi:hypothetical protein